MLPRVTLEYRHPHYYSAQTGVSMPSRVLWLALAFTVLSCTACSVMTPVRRNTRAVDHSSATIAANTQAVATSTNAMTSLVPALQGVQRLEEPMKEVAALDARLRSVAELNQPMSRVAGLDPSIRAVADLRAPMMQLVGIHRSLDAAAALGEPIERLAQMRSSLDSVASLRDPMTRVAALDARLAAVASLRDPIQELAGLREPMAQVAALEQPMTRLAGILDHPVLLLACAVVGLALWGAVTFVAVRLAILSAGRRL
jgi:uncharacterized protein YoxC